MFWWIILLIGIYCFWQFYISVIKPYVQLRYYRKFFSTTNYKVNSLRFIPFMSEMFLVGFSDQKKHNDSLYSVKYLSSQYDISLCNFGKQAFIILHCPDLIKELYSKDVSGQYRKQKEVIRGLKRLIGSGLTFSEGDLWKKKRKYATIFLNYNYVNLQSQLICNIIDLKIEQFSNGKTTFAVNLLELCQQITSTTVVQLFFGGGEKSIGNLQIQNKKLGRYVREIIQKLGQQLFDPTALLFGFKFFQYGLTKRDRDVTKRLNLFHKAAQSFVEQRIQQIKQGKNVKQDYVSAIYKSVKQEQITPQFIESIADDFTALFGAGTDTTSHSVMMMIYYCLMHQQVLKKLLKQIDTFVNDETINHQTLKQMKYLDYVFHETMRFYQPANGIFFRQAQFDHYLGDIPIKKGTLLMPSTMCTHYDPKNYVNPHQFKPQRWMNEDGSTMIPKSYTWLPFSTGPRGCVGKSLAQLQMKLIVIKILKKYKLTMQSTKLDMRMLNFSYQPQKMQTTFERIM